MNGRLAAGIVLLLALAAFAAWRIEVEWVKGWAGSGWLHSYPWSAIPICLCVATAILVSVSPKAPVNAGAAIAFLLIATCLCWVAFEITRQWIYEAAGRRLLAPSAARWLPSPLLSIPLAAVGLLLAIDHLLVRLRPSSVGFFIGALALVWPLSWLSLQLLPAHGYRDAVHVVKAGYPPFWTTALMGAAAALAVRRAR